MRRAEVRVHGVRAGILEEFESGRAWRFVYEPGYQGPPVSLTMPVVQREHLFDGFPPFFEGLLPEGAQLEALLRLRKIDRTDHFGQLVVVGRDLVGAVTVHELE